MLFRRFTFPACFLIIALASAGPAFAHPHVWISARAEVLFETGNIAAVRHVWTFDEAFSIYVVQGLDKNGDGTYSREELKDLARENVESLKEFEYFTFGNLAGIELEFAPPKDEWLSFDGKLLTLHFDLPLKQAAPVKQAVIEVYDPSYYVEFKFADDKAVALAGSPPGCSVLVKKPPELDAAAQQKLAEAEFNAIESEFAAEFANRAVLACP
jgi:ABC-type uncharacterized transport system substrate-binding protein